jgi:succinoglycan biosynthesis transport protein ExoP
MEPTTDEPDFDIREYLRVLRRRKWVILAVTVACVVAAIGLSSAQKRIYSASARVLIPQDPIRDLNPQGSTANFSTSDLLDRALDNEIGFAQGDRVKAAARQKLGFAPKVSVAKVTGTDSLLFTARSTEQAAAASQANLYADTYLDQRRSSRTDDYAKTSQTLQGQIQALQADRAKLPNNDPRIAALQSSIDNLQSVIANLNASGQLAQAGGQVIERAVKPSQPTSPKVSRNAILAFALGLVLGVGAAFVVDRLDDSVKSKHDLEVAGHGLTVIGLVPQTEGWRDSKDSYVVSMDKPQSPSSESYRMLRTSVQILGIEEPMRVLGFTSPRAGEGKSTSVANLGIALARAGQRVVVVGCDFRRPRIHEFYGVSNSVGFTSVLLGDVSLPEALQPVEGYARLRVLASGPAPPNPSELLSLKRVHDVIDWLQGDADYVLLDCPPVLPVPDALQVSRLAHGMIVVVAARRTGKREVSRTVEVLRQVEAPLVGTVLNGVQHSGGYDYGYGAYDYGYEYGEYVPEADAGPLGRLPIFGRRGRNGSNGDRRQAQERSSSR